MLAHRPTALPCGRRRLRCLPSSLVSNVPEARGAAHRPYRKLLISSSLVVILLHSAVIAFAIPEDAA